MNRRFLSAMAIGLGTMAASLLGSCSSDNADILKNVPYDAAYVMTFDLENLLEEAEISVSGDSLVLPESLSAFKNQIPTEVSTAVAAIYNAIDPECVAIYTTDAYSQPEPVLLFTIADQSKLESQLTSFEHSSADGFDIYEKNGAVLMVKGNQGWVVNRRKMIDTVMADIKASADKSILDQEIAAKALRADNDFNSVIYPGNYMAMPQFNYWIVSQGDMEGSKATTRIRAYGSDGKELSLKDNVMLDHISSEALRYMAANTVGMMAVGFNKDFDWNAYSSIMMMSGMHRSNVQMLVQILNALDGTVAVGIAPKSDKPFDWTTSTPADWTLTATAQIKEEQASQLIEQAKSLASMTGTAINDATPTGFTMTNKDFTVYVNYADGMLNLSVNTPAREQANDLGSVTDGKYFSALVRIPALSTVFPVKGLDFGYEISYELEETELKLTMEVTGRKIPVMESVYRIFDALNTYISDGNRPNPANGEISEEVVEELVNL